MISLFQMSMTKSKKASATYTANNTVKLIRGGSAYFDLLENLISLAKDTIHLQVYIFEEDETGKRVGEALIAAANRNVKVFLMVDAYASKSISKPFIKKLCASGIEFRFFEPLFKSKNFYFGRRLHHKILLVDNSVALVGGINISNHYNDMPDVPAWLDFALLSAGDIVKELCAVCWKTWNGFYCR